MIRPFISYVLTALILVSQIGLPIHMHYCKGFLESVSVFVAAKCGDHQEPANLPSCCKKASANHCTKTEDKKCCDDEVLVLKQEITSITPTFIKWIDTVLDNVHPVMPEISPVAILLPGTIERQSSDSGPPIFILYHSLIFYA